MLYGFVVVTQFASSRTMTSGFPARPGSKDGVSSQLFGSQGSNIFGTELAHKAIGVLGSSRPTSHGRTRPWGEKRNKLKKYQMFALTLQDMLQYILRCQLQLISILPIG